MVASWYFSYEDVLLWDQQEYARAMTSWPIFHDLLNSDFGQFSMVKIFVISRFLRLYLCETSRVCCHSKGSCFRVGARGQYLGHHVFCLISWRLVNGWILYLKCWFSVTQTLTGIYVHVCRSVTYISWSSDFGLFEGHPISNANPPIFSTQIDQSQFYL